MVCGDFEDWEAFVGLVGDEVHRQFSEGATEVWMKQTVRAAAQEMGCDEDDAWDFAADASGDIWSQVSETLTTIENFVGNQQFQSDVVSALRFGNGFVYVCYDSNTDRFVDDDRIVAEFALDDAEGLEAWKQTTHYEESEAEMHGMTGDQWESHLAVTESGESTTLKETNPPQPKRSGDGVQIHIDTSEDDWLDKVGEAYTEAAKALGFDPADFDGKPPILLKGDPSIMPKGFIDKREEYARGEYRGRDD